MFLFLLTMSQTKKKTQDSLTKTETNTTYFNRENDLVDFLVF
jgi:hypothetical protein